MITEVEIDPLKGNNLYQAFPFLVSALSILSVLGGGIWFAAQLGDRTQVIPELVHDRNLQSNEIAVLQDQQHYTDIRYNEIVNQLAEINNKLDRQKEVLEKHNQPR